MITIKGKYNSANVMIDEIDETTRAQIQGFLNHPAFADTYISIMPDCHAGKGAVVGFTMKVNKYIIPNILGVDLGCGMLSAHFDVESVDLTALDRFIKQHIPSGFNINKIPILEHINASFKAELEGYCELIGMDFNKALCSIASLGGGNHFHELGKTNSGQYRFTIHSGSRNFGLRVANYYQAKAKANLQKYFLGGQHKDLEFLLVDDEDGQAYLSAARFAASYASLNRKIMMQTISKFFNSEPLDLIESVHNFLGEDGIIRKGATPAHKDEMVIIPFNMRDGIALCRGKGSDKYNQSAPHGAGRILSRTKAKAQLNVETFQKQMADADIYTTTATKDTLDESPDAYKDKELIMKNIVDTVDVVDMIKPVYNFKAGGD